jgi:hypothetical protein
VARHATSGRGVAFLLSGRSVHEQLPDKNVNARLHGHKINKETKALIATGNENFQP